jgi:mono/diheme cytochrome c family protein
MRIALLLALAACGTARRGLPVAAEPALDDSARLGQLAFYEHCHACHPDGEAGLGPALNNRPLPGFLVRVQVREGFGGMPAFRADDLPPADLDAIVAYLDELRAAPPAAAE